MKIRVLTFGATQTLKDKISDNIDKYSNGSKSWIEEFFADKRNTMVSRINEPDIELLIGEGNSTDNDCENAKRLFEAYPQLTPEFASDERLWATLCHKYYFDYMRDRWPAAPKNKNQTAIGIVKQRYFFMAGPRKSQERNGLSRLWLCAALTYDPNRTNAYELTEIMLQNTNNVMFLLGHTFGSSKTIIKGTMEAILTLQNETGRKISKTPVKEFARRLNLMGGATVLDMLEQEEVRKLGYGFMRPYAAND